VLLGSLPLSLPAQAADQASSVAANPADGSKPDLHRSHFDYKLNPGQPARDSIYIINTGTKPQSVTLYARDAFTTAAGEFAVQAQKDRPIDVGNWVRFYNGKSTISKTLKAHQYMTIPFDVTSPTNATPGDHVGAIVVSSAKVSGDINLVQRVAVRLYVRMSGQVKPRLELTNLRIASTASSWNPFSLTHHLSYDITNVGNVSVAADVSVQPSGWFGARIGRPVVTRIPDMLPGTSHHVEQDVNSWQMGTDKMTIIYEGIFDANSIQAQQPRGRVDQSQFVTPTGWLPLSALLVMGFISIATLLFRRRRNRRA